MSTRDVRWNEFILIKLLLRDPVYDLYSYPGVCPHHSFMLWLLPGYDPWLAERSNLTT